MSSNRESHGFIRSDNTEWEDAGEGIRRRVLGHDPDLMMVRVQFRSGAVGCVHKHPHRQVTYVESGKFEVEIDSRKEILKEGDSFIVGPHIPHGVTALEDGCLIDVFSPAREDFLKKERT